MRTPPSSRSPTSASSATSTKSSPNSPINSDAGGGIGRAATPLSSPRTGSGVQAGAYLNVCDGAARWVPEPVRHDEKRVAALYQCWEIHVRSEEHTSELQSLMRI